MKPKYRVAILAAILASAGMAAFIYSCTIRVGARVYYPNAAQPGTVVDCKVIPTTDGKSIGFTKSWAEEAQ